jgi:hypothetical protein
MKKLFEQNRKLKFDKLKDETALDPTVRVRKPTNGNDNVVVTPPVITKKLDMSLLKPFKPTSTSDGGQRITVNGVTYTFYQNGKVWVSNLKKHVDWTSKNGKILVNGVELKQSSTGGGSNKADKIKQAKRLKYQKQLIRNAIIFYETISKLSIRANWDEETIYKVMAKYITPDNAPYIDALLRMIRGDVKDLRRKYLPAYNYWLSRNGESGTTFQYLVNLPVFYQLGAVTGLNDIITGKYGDYLDLDSTDPKIVKLKKQLRAVFPNIMKATANLSGTYDTTPMNGEMDQDRIHKMVMDIYNTKAFGPIKKIK